MPTFSVQIINNTTPAISVEAADSGVPAVTYQQIKQSLGAQVYKVDELYLYSENINQLLGVIQYQRFDADGNQSYSSIATTINPYDGNGVAILVDLKKYKDDFILNGNSSFSGTILPNTYLQIKFWANRITNELGRNFNNFKQIEIDANKPFFFDRESSIMLPELQSAQQSQPIQEAQAKEVQQDYTNILFLGIAAIATGAYMFKSR